MYPKPSPWPGRAAGVFLVLACLTFGLLAGIIIATRVFSSAAVGWDQLMDALSGGLLGGLAGGTLGVFLWPRTGIRERLIGAVLCLLLAALCFIGLRTTSPRLRPPKTQALVAKAGPAARLQMPASDSNAPSRLRAPSRAEFFPPEACRSPEECRRR